MEENLRTERVELKTPTREISTSPSVPHISAEPLRKPQKNKAFSQSFLTPVKRQKSHSLELSSDVLDVLKQKFNQLIEEKRRLQLRANGLLCRLGLFKKKLTPITVSGVQDSRAHSYSQSPPHSP